MILAIQITAIWFAFCIALVLQRLHVVNRRERQLSFAGEPHPRSETDATNAAPPASRGLVASDKLARLS